MKANRAIADRLREAAVVLEAQGASPFRAAAYRNAAVAIDELTEAVRATFDAEAVTGLDTLPSIGRGIAAAIAEMLTSGRWDQLDACVAPPIRRDCFKAFPASASARCITAFDFNRSRALGLHSD